ncbi:helix-turn-helix domain-containing protein [Psychrobacter sp. A3]|uniref:helix-turn-helix domain-containing protein n=1 Tax=Psychrobacter sp. A3 TaxID=2992754 RepID=UPI00406C007A
MTTTAAAPVTNEQAPKTQIVIIRVHLMTGATITIWESIRLYRITSLAPRIYDLRAEGLIIQSEMVKHNNKWFAVYWLDEPTLVKSELSNSEVAA